MLIRRLNSAKCHPVIEKMREVSFECKMDDPAGHLSLPICRG